MKPLMKKWVFEEGTHRYYDGIHWYTLDCSTKKDKEDIREFEAEMSSEFEIRNQG